jgi:hypothetical protein
MIQLDAQAQEHLEGYLSQVKAYLRGCRSIDPAEVDRDVREHIERELQKVPGPVSFREVDVVLSKLGSPTQWVPEEALSWWRKFVVRMRTGPSDWRLAYAAFGTLVLGFVLLVTFVLTPVSLVLIPAAFCLSRAAVSLVDDPDELGGQKWLLYPALIIVYVALFLALILGPAACLGTLLAVDRVEHFDVLPWSGFGDLGYWLTSSMFIVAVTGLWGFVLACVHRRWPAFFPTVFRPFAGGLRHKRMNWLMAVGACVFIIFAVAGALMVKYPGWQSG